jgi:hypothetical protein
VEELYGFYPAPPISVPSVFEPLLHRTTAH